MNNFSAAIDHLQRGTKQLILEGLWGSSKAYCVALLEQALPRPCLILTPSQKRAEECYEDLLFFQRIGEFPYPPEQIHLYSQWDIAPYEQALPHREIVSERLTVLDKLLNNERLVIVAPVEAVLHRTLPHQTLHEFTLYIGVGEELDRDQLVTTLIDTGYKHTQLVENRGEFSVRGGIVDIFPPFGEYPLRIELFGDEVESLRAFDPATQRSVEHLELVNILPGREMILSDSTCLAAKERIEQRVAEIGTSYNALNALMKRIDEKIFFPGVDWYAPYFHGALDSLFEYLPQDALIFLDEPAEIAESRQKFHAAIQKRFRGTEVHNLLFPPPESLYLTPETLESRLNAHQQIHLQMLGVRSAAPQHEIPTRSLEWAYTIVPNEKGVEDQDQHIASTTKRLQEWVEDGYHVVLTAYTAGQAKRLWEILHDHRVPARVAEIESSAASPSASSSFQRPEFLREDPEVTIVVGTLNCGFVFVSQTLIFLNEDEFLGKKTVRRRHVRRKKPQPSLSLGELEINDYVVHIDHGIGIYLGLKKITVQGIAMECLHLEYSGGDKLYVPIDRLDLVQKYKGADQRRPKIDKLGGTNWARVKERVKASVEKMARELLETYAARQALPGVQFSIDEHLYREFEASFEFEETPDQAQAIEDVARDMASPKPMDRLICGDVGYGKTEVAMRAAFRTVLSGKQVAILVPTTLLAQQHYQTFERRFAPYPVHIGLLSRFKTRKEQQEVVKGVKEGTIDIVIGTHRLLQKDVAFKDLGLVIIDEEQRFGVSHKEKIRQYRKLVDVLALTATPIPRTLHMSLMGVRDLSIIETPPEGRLAVRTYVSTFDDEVISEAISTELDRGGQVFFVHNKINTIEGLALRVRQLLPHAKIAVAHGQMKEHQLEAIMLRFINREIDVLISTTIVESGLDIPSVNTIIINRAHEFGLSQLYQLRGRIGRARERAYAYLLVSPEQLLTSDAKKRLRVIQELSELGSGFKLASHDLEIRGAGDLLGAEQTGHISALGFDLYCHIIEQTVKEIKGQPLEEEFYPQIDMQVSAHFPSDYIPDMHQRLEMYKRLMSSTDFAQILDVEEEIRDRYGSLPLETQNLVSLAELTLIANDLRVQQIQASDGVVSLVFDEHSSVTDQQLKRAAKSSDSMIRHPSARRLVVETKRLRDTKKIACIKNILQTMR
ncbi:transcription-repair coupling factor [candidate division KSB3 bacterium]|uniref:Transcription-repair-coupling factor n=1 Tax=candidate division KSB3 bacterium TaxID=2044937 RepID=A0A9D5Q591_9BACT|nr:transcription-repair coupling factor [candidate division KSB3 bacterium]MBD3324012.1 transcription-repair coupling factor [candidate division KSB3 bacterium]